MFQRECHKKPRFSDITMWSLVTSRYYIVLGCVRGMTFCLAGLFTESFEISKNREKQEETDIIKNVGGSSWQAWAVFLVPHPPKHWSASVCLFRSDTSQKQRRPLPSCPMAIALVPLTCPSKNLQFPQRVSFTKEKMPWCPSTFKHEAHIEGCLVILYFPI